MLYQNLRRTTYIIFITTIRSYLQCKIQVITMETRQQFLIKRIFSPYILTHKHGKAIQYQHFLKRMLHSNRCYTKLGFSSNALIIEYNIPLIHISPSRIAFQFHLTTGKTYHPTIRFLKFLLNALSPAYRMKLYILMDKKQKGIMCPRSSLIIRTRYRPLFFTIINSNDFIINTNSIMNIPGYLLQTFGRYRTNYD